jgi:hypothetical protein
MMPSGHMGADEWARSSTEGLKISEGAEAPN